MEGLIFLAMAYFAAFAYSLAWNYQVLTISSKFKYLLTKILGCFYCMILLVSLSWHGVIVCQPWTPHLPHLLLWSQPPTVLLTISLIAACIHKALEVGWEEVSGDWIEVGAEIFLSFFPPLKWSDKGPYRWSFRAGISFSLWQVHTASDHRSLILAINMSSPTSISMLSSYSGLGLMAFFLPELAMHWLKMADCDVLVIRPPTSFNMIVLSQSLGKADAQTVGKKLRNEVKQYYMFNLVLRCWFYHMLWLCLL